MGRKLAIIISLAFVCSINHVYSGSKNKISDLSTKFRYALFLLNDIKAQVIRNFLLTKDSQVKGCCPVKFYQGRYYRVYLLPDDGSVCAFLCDDVQMLSGASLPANTPHVTPTNTPIIEHKVNPFFPPDDRSAFRIPSSFHRPPVIIAQRLTPEALASLTIKLDRLSSVDNLSEIRQLEHEISSEREELDQKDTGDALFFYLKKRPNMNENRIFFTHNRDSVSNIIMVIRQSFPTAEGLTAVEEESDNNYTCLEISIPVGTFEFASVEELLSMQNEYPACTVPWQQHVSEHGVPDDMEGSLFEPVQSEFSSIALLDCLQELEENWRASNPIGNPMVERVIGTGISSVVVSLFHNFRSLAFKRLYMTTKNKEDAQEVLSSARINLLLLSIYEIPVAPMRYEMVYNRFLEHYAIYCIQPLYQPEQFADHLLEDPDAPVEEKKKLINTIIHYMSLCDISNGYQLKVDHGFKGYFRVGVDSNYPNYCLIGDVWNLIDLSPFFWCVGDHFSVANQYILDMSQSEDYYSFIKSLCTNPVQLHVFFCGRLFRPHQKYSRSLLPDHQRKASEWLGLYNYALRRVATLPQIIREFEQPHWQELSTFDEEGQQKLWQTLIKQRNTDPSHEYLEGVADLVTMNSLSGHPLIIDGTAESWQELPEEYQLLTESMGYIDPFDYLSATPEQRSGKQLSDIFEMTQIWGMESPEALLRYALSTETEEPVIDQRLLGYLRIQAIMKVLSQNMAEDNNERANNRRRMLRKQRESNPPPTPIIYTHLTAMNNEEMADYLNLHFNAEYLPVDSDGNCMWNAIARILRRKGVIIDPQQLMQAVLPDASEQESSPAHQQNWGDTDFISKILQYLAGQGIHVGIVVMQPYGAQMVGVWYGLIDGEMTIQPIGSNPFELQQAIQDSNNITLVNHQNGLDGDHQVNHWGGVVPIPLPANTAPPLISHEPAPEEPVIDDPVATTDTDEPFDEQAQDTASPAILSPQLFEQQFHNLTGRNLLPASNTLPHSLPGSLQPLTNFRNRLLSLIANYLLMCNRNPSGCSHQLSGILSLLPENQSISNQDLQSGSIEPFLHLMTAFLHWMNPQPVFYNPSDLLLAPDALHGITLIFPVIGQRGLPVYAAWRLTLASTVRGYVHVKRQFIRELDFRHEDLSSKNHLYFVTNIPVTPMGNFAWPFHTPLLAQWWLVVPQVSAVWMLGTAFAEHVGEPGDNPDPGSRDLQRELSDEVSHLGITAPSHLPQRATVPFISIAPPSPEPREESSEDKDDEEEGQNNMPFYNVDSKREHNNLSQHRIASESTQQLSPYSWELPVPDVLSIGKILVPMLLYGTINSKL